MLPGVTLWLYLFLLRKHYHVLPPASNVNPIPVGRPLVLATNSQHPDIVCSLPGDNAQEKDSNMRTEFQMHHVLVKAFPSAGGIVIGHLSAVQLKQLGLPNLQEVTRSPDDAEEDALSLALMKQGAHWWPSWTFYQHHTQRLKEKGFIYDFHYPPRINVGYPSSGRGVWVLKFSEDMDWSDDDSIPFKPYLSPEPDRFRTHIHMALTADERCEVLKSLGAKFYETVEDCEDIPRTFEEGHERGNRYEVMLKKVDDDEYVDWWLRFGAREDGFKDE